MHHGPGLIEGVEFFGEWRAVKKPYRLGLHKNPGLEIVLISKGKTKWVIETKETDLRANMVFYTLPWQEHGGVEEIEPSCEISYLCLNLAKKYAKPQRRFEFHRSLGFALDEAHAISSALTENRVQALPANREIAWLFAHFFKIARDQAPLRQTQARDTIKLIIAQLAGLAAGGRQVESRSAEAERRVRKLIDILAARHAEPWTLQAMSDACQLGRTQFSQLLKKQTGDTPVTFLNRVRLREAQRLLRQSTTPITEIALAVGFNSSQYFATIFKEFTGMDARGFRNQSSKHPRGDCKSEWRRHISP